MLFNGSCVGLPATMVPIRSTDTVVVLGDSITVATWYTGLSVTAPATWLNSGSSGLIAADAVGSIATLVVNKAPTVGIIQIGVNDAIAATDAISFRMNYQIIVNTFRRLVGNKFIGVSILCDGEKQTAGAWSGNDYDVQIAAKNAIMQDIVEKGGGAWADVRTNLLAWEIANNALNASGHVFCWDDPGIHPTYPTAPDPVNGTFDARLLMSTWVGYHVTP
jgi:hypothetical protein